MHRHQEPPNLILLDFHLSDMDGERVMQRLLGEPSTRNIPVVILTADLTRQSRPQGVEGRSVKCLSKPIDLWRFIAMVDEGLGVRRAPAGAG